MSNNDSCLTELIAYVAGPYQAPTKAGVSMNIARAAEVAMELWAMGFTVICPHTNTALFDGVVSRERFLEGDLEIIRRCVDVMVMLPAWTLSEGAKAERELALELGIPVYQWGLVADEKALRELASQVSA